MRSTGRSTTEDIDGVRISTGHAGERGGYLTDGINLHRYLGTIRSATGNLIGLENCRSLDVTLWPVGDLNARQLRAVDPATSD
jgi:hypothetical protein